MSTDIMKIVPSTPSIIDLEPEEVVERAVRIAKSLATLIRMGGMVTKIEGKDYVTVEGWNAMGTLMGFVPKVILVTELDDGSFEAQVDICTKAGLVLSSASARCGMDEARWAKVPVFSRRSMAITRAIGKAYRIGFSWVMAVAELSVTPAEDMPGFEPRNTRREVPPHPADPLRVARRDGERSTWNGQWPKRGG